MAEKSAYRIELEARAAAAKVSFAPNIGDGKLAERVTAAEDAKNTQGDGEPAKAGRVATAPGAQDAPRAATGGEGTAAGGEADHGLAAKDMNGTPKQSETKPPEVATGAPAKAGAKDGAPATTSGRALVVEVIGPKRGRWRAGRHFTLAPVVIPLGDLTEAEQAALASDPALTVTTREVDTE